MILKLLKSIIEPKKTVSSECSPQGNSAVNKAGVNLNDIAHEAIRQDAEKFNVVLRAAGSSIDRSMKKEKIKKKAKRTIDPIFADDELVEEITERALLDATENDPYYETMFKD